MSIFTGLLRWFSGTATLQKKGEQSPIPSSSPYDYAPMIGSDSALQVSTVWACVKLLVETISSLPLFLYEPGENGGKQPAKANLLYRIFHDTPNKRHTSQEFWEFMLLNLFLRGNAYAQIMRNAKGDVVGLWPLAAEQVSVKVMEDGEIIYTYCLDNKDLIFLEKDVLHIRGMGNGVIGLSPLDYMRSSIGLAIDAQNHTQKVYKKEARRPGILMSDKVLTKEQRDALRASFSEIVTGGQKELFILEAEFKFEPLGMTPADLQILETRKFAVEDLARWFGVPAVLINDNSSTTAWGTGIQQIVQGFYKFTIRPQLERIEQAINRKVISPSQRSKGLEVEFNFDALLRASLEDRLNAYSKAVQNGLKTRNECRKLENDPSLPGGDVLTAQTNLAPIDMLPVVNGGSVPDDVEPIRQ